MPGGNEGCNGGWLDSCLEYLVLEVKVPGKNVGPSLGLNEKGPSPPLSAVEELNEENDGAS